MEIVPIDNQNRIFISPDIDDSDDWKYLDKEGISVIIDVDGDLDIGIPTIPNHILYVYFPFIDDDLPNPEKLHAVAAMGADLYRSGQKILVHCSMGYNRSALVIGMILIKLGMSGKEAVELIRLKRKGALFNKKYFEYLEGIS